MKPIVWTQDLQKVYGSGESAVHALRGANIAIGRGEAVAVVGPSGSGKSTLLHLIGGLDRPSDGRVYVDDQDIFARKGEPLAQYRRRKIGFVFQMFHLLPQLSVTENVTLPLGLDRRPVDQQHLGELLSTLGLTEKRDRLPGQLSGGQQQRVAIARALIARPSIVLADEPTGNLDSKSGADVLNLLRLAVDKYRQTLMIITHDERIARQCDRMLYIEDGVVREG